MHQLVVENLIRPIQGEREGKGKGGGGGRGEEVLFFFNRSLLMGKVGGGGEGGSGQVIAC